MKTKLVCSVLATLSVITYMNLSNNIATPQASINMKSYQSVVTRYDKSMSSKTIKAAVIDSYFREVSQNGKIVRWNKDTMPLTVYIQNTSDLPDYYYDIVLSAYKAWQRASEGLVTFQYVDNPNEANMKCYFKNTDNKDSLGVHAFAVNGSTITDSVIVFNKTDAKGKKLDTKQLFSTALQEIGHSLGLTGKSSSIYDVMYPVGTKFNTEITPRDLKTLALVYSVIPDITNKPLTQEERSQLFTTNQILQTLNVEVNDNTNLEEYTPGSIDAHLALAEQYRKRAEYDKAAKEYQTVAATKTDRRSQSEVYYEIAVTYLDAEMYDKANQWANVACNTDMNDLTITLPALIDYYTKQSETAIDQLENILQENPSNKHAYKLLCKIYRDKHHENLLNSTIRRYSKTAGDVVD